MSIFSFFTAYKRCHRLEKSDLVFPLRTKLYGVKIPDHQGALVQSLAGDGLQFVHVPKSEHPYKVYAYSITLNRLLGYLDKSLAKQLIFIFGKGFCLDGEIEEIIGDSPLKCRGAYVYIFDDNVLMKDMDTTNLHG